MLIRAHDSLALSSVSCEAMKKDDVKIHFFVRTCCLSHCTKSEVVDLIKPQGVKSKIVAPDSYVEDSANAELIVPASSVAPEEIVLGNIDVDIYDEETAVSVSTYNNESALHEEKEADPGFHCDEDLEDVSVAESVDDFDFSS